MGTTTCAPQPVCCNPSGEVGCWRAGVQLTSPDAQEYKSKTKEEVAQEDVELHLAAFETETLHVTAHLPNTLEPPGATKIGNDISPWCETTSDFALDQNKSESSLQKDYCETAVDRTKLIEDTKITELGFPRGSLEAHAAVHEHPRVYKIEEFRRNRAAFRRNRLIKQVLFVFAALVIACVGAIMVLMMLIASSTEDEPQGSLTKSKEKTAPDMPLVLSLLGGMLVASVVWGLMVLNSTTVVRTLRGSLEYTVLMFMNMQNGVSYKYIRFKKDSGPESQKSMMRREIHQLKVEAGLAGWTAEHLEEQMKQVKKSYDAHEETQNKKELIEADAAKTFTMVKNTIGAMPILLALVSVVFAFATVAVGAIGMFLTLKIAHAPNEEDDPLWIELSWQTINCIFTILVVWKGPGRAQLFYHFLRHDFEAEIDGVQRSLVMPGVLLMRGEVRNIAVLRFVNVVCQYLVCFFMWAWLPRCIQEEIELHVDCTSRPPWGVPVFLVLGMGTDIAANAILHNYIVKCEYVKWPTDAIDGPLLSLETNDGEIERQMSGEGEAALEKN